MKRPRFLPRRSKSLFVTTSLLLAVALPAGAHYYDVPAGQTETVSEALTGDSGLTKDGEGTLVLTAFNSYTGSTVVNAGELQISGSLGAISHASDNVFVHGTLSITDGGYLNALNGTIAGTGGGIADVHVQGSSLSLSGGLSVGKEGDGLFNIGAGSMVLITGALLAGSDGADGQIWAGGSGATMSVGSAVIGVDGNGVLDVSGGVVVSVAGDLTAGDGAGVTGALSIGDQNSLINVGGNVTLANSGAATLEMDDMARLIVQGSLYGAVAANSVATLTLSGTAFIWVADDFYLADGGSASLSLLDGANIEVGSDVIVGNKAGSQGSLWLQGSYVNLTATNQLMVGVSGTGSVHVSDGASIKASEVHIGYESGSLGSVTISGSGSGFTATKLLTVGNAGNGSFSVLEGASVYSGTLLAAANGAAQVLVDGKGSSLYTGYLEIIGNGSLTVSNGGYLNNSGSAALGTSSEATLSLNNGSFVQNGGLTLGSVNLTITNGGALSTYGAVTFQNNTRAITISGADSHWYHWGGDLDFYGSNTVELRNGGELLVNSGTITIYDRLELVIGNPEQSVTGAAPGIIDALLIQTQGGAALGRVILNHNADNYTFGVDLDGQFGVYQMNGVTTFVNSMTFLPGSLFWVLGGTANMVEASLQTGTLGTMMGNLEIRDGSEVTTSALVVAEAGSVIVSGSHSRLEGLAMAYVGIPATSPFSPSAVASLRIEDGAVAKFDPDVTIGAGLQGVVTVTGQGSTLEVRSGTIILGEYDDSVNQFIDGKLHRTAGVLTIADGGVVDLSKEAAGTLLLSGTGSALNLGAGPGQEAVAAGQLKAAVVTSGTNGTGVVNFNHTATENDPYQFLPSITGSAGVQHFAGFTVLAGTNTYTGNTVIYGGTLSIASTAALSSDSQISLQGSNAGLDLNSLSLTVDKLEIHGGQVVNGQLQSNTPVEMSEGRLGAILGGTTALNKTGSGTATIEGNQQYTGATNIYGGVLEVLGTLQSGSSTVYGGTFRVTGEVANGVQVDGGILVVNGTVGGSVGVVQGLLSGTGYIAGNLSNFGTVAPGNSPGTLHVSGDYVQGSGATLQIEIKSPKEYDRLEVGGSAKLDGNLQVVLGGKPGDESYEVLTAAGGVSGKFSKASTNTLLKVDVTYLDNAVELTFTESSFLDFARDRKLSRNQHTIARMLDRAHVRGELAELLEELYYTDLDALPGILANLSPEGLTQLFQMGFNAAQVQYGNIERRLDDVRNGATGFSANGLSLTNPRGSLNYDGSPIVNTRDGLQLAGFDGKSLVAKQHVAPVVTESRWGFFATGSGEWADVETTGHAHGSQFTTGGLTVGADYRVSNNFVLGIAGGYTNLSSKLFNDGKIDVNNGRGSVYATVFGNGFYANAMVGGAYNSYRTKRKTFGGTAKANPDGGEFNALLGGGYDYCRGGWTIGPVASLQYTYLGLNSFTERGSLAPMHFPSQSQNSLRSQLGGRIAYAWNVDNSVVIRPEVRLQWQHEYLDSTASIESAFAGNGSVFSVDGPALGRDSLILDAGVTVQFGVNTALYAAYTAEIGRKNYSSNTISGGFRINF